ncbi:hypothetical protein ES288_D04G141400v1 [Gossypium darwinii]|uniref:Uncharacterized protein n=1 Tax=Gossypium darwinii TaxID=34276 RepID=A0A5D2CWE4_GOSDA|nr:hypothetical protein ES288_D04G141400v1 [Gossypium darwinii]
MSTNPLKNNSLQTEVMSKLHNPSKSQCLYSESEGNMTVKLCAGTQHLAVVVCPFYVASKFAFTKGSIARCHDSAREPTLAPVKYYTTTEFLNTMKLLHHQKINTCDFISTNSMSCHQHIS